MKQHAENIEQCFACDVLLAKGSWQDHHFPIPRELGGKASVKLCLPCHDMVDRFNLEHWTTEFVGKAWASMPRESRLFLLKAVALFARMNAKKG